MKTIILSIIIAFFCVAANAEVVREGNTFKTEQTSKSNDTKTKYTWQDKSGKSYPIYVSKRGACYVIRVSKKTNQEYKYYLPKDVQATIKKEMNIK
jgi:hypothetical protein